MSLPLSERLVMGLVPSWLYYRRKIAVETAGGEHELEILHKLVTPGGTAIDVGANQGFFAYAFSELADRVEAFEPNPDYAGFARRMLGARAHVHEIALSNRNGAAEFVVPVSQEGIVMHLAGNLKGATAQHPRSVSFEVALRTLDSFAFEDVRAIKIDVEGSELEVLEGGRETILRDRPVLVVELLSGTFADPAACTQAICETYGYTAWIVHAGERIEAMPVIRGLGSNTTFGSPYLNRNVLFVPRPGPA